MELSQVLEWWWTWNKARCLLASCMSGFEKRSKDRNGPPWAVAKEFGVMSSGCSWSTLWNSPGIGPRCFQRAWYTILLGHGDQFQGRRHTTENHSRLCRRCVLLILCFTEYPAARVAKIYNKGLNMERSAWSFLLLHLILLDSCTYRIHQNTKQSSGQCWAPTREENSSNRTQWFRWFIHNRISRRS